MGDNEEVLTAQRLRLEYRKASELQENPRNWRDHPRSQVATLEAVIGEVGWAGAALYNETTGRLIDGHLRRKIASKMGKDYEIPVIVGSWTEDQEKILLALFDPISALAQPNKEKLRGLLSAIETRNEQIREVLGLVEEGTIAKPTGYRHAERRKLPFDMIYSLGGDSTCCLAVRCGFKYGVQSQKNLKLCPYTKAMAGHEVCFVDNEFKDYDHSLHVDCVAALTPKYATVRDAMTRAQCDSLGIKYYPLDAILKWADQLKSFAENVIVIPKAKDLLKQIPPDFVLGYSIPTTYGGTHIDPEAFRGRRIHLLGGSWKDQLAYLGLLGEDVVSLDGNQVTLIAHTGQWIDHEGAAHPINDAILFNNPKYVAVSLSFACMSEKVKTLITQTISMGAVGYAINKIQPAVEEKGEAEAEKGESKP
jgi:hypothetical protein